MTYPGAGIAVSTGSSWTTSYNSGNPVPTTSGGTGNTTGLASGLTGSPNITVSSVSSFGNISTSGGIISNTASAGYSALQVNGVGFGGATTTISSVNGGGILNFNISGSITAALGSTQFVPVPTGTVSLGSAGLYWSEIWVSTGAFNTSDGTQKQQIAELTTAEIAVAKVLKGLIRTYKLNDSVAKKGANARIHTGVIAQNVQAAFVAQGLDVTKYGIFGSDTWYEVDGSPIDSNGSNYTSSTVGAVSVTRLSIRYDELFAFIIAGL